MFLDFTTTRLLIKTKKQTIIGSIAFSVSSLIDLIFLLVIICFVLQWTIRWRLEKAGKNRIHVMTAKRWGHFVKSDNLSSADILQYNPYLNVIFYKSSFPLSRFFLGRITWSLTYGKYMLASGYLNATTVGRYHDYWSKVSLLQLLHSSLSIIRLLNRKRL